MVHETEGESDRELPDLDKKHRLPIVGIVVTISPSFNLYKIVVLPAASRPTFGYMFSLSSQSANIIADIPSIYLRKGNDVSGSRSVKADMIW